MTIEPPSLLRVLNRTQARVRLRFRCDGAQLWDTWLAAGATLAAPNPRDGEIVASATFADPRTNVTYTVPSPVTHLPVCLIARQTFVEGARCFGIDQEPFGQPGKIRLLNLTAADLRFSLRFMNSPFELTMALAPHAEHVQGFGMDLSATIDGVTVVSGAIRSWASDVLIEVAKPEGEAFPRIGILPREQNRS
jgi:hypothetical protein